MKEAEAVADCVRCKDKSGFLEEQPSELRPEAEGGSQNRVGGMCSRDRIVATKTLR